MMDSPSHKFGVVCGRVTEEEEEYLIAKGLKYENSMGELLEISTDVDDMSYSSLLSESQQESLMVFEENEKLFTKTQAAGDKDALICTLSKSRASLSFHQSANKSNLEAVEEELFADEEDKENIYYGHGEPSQDCRQHSKMETGVEKADVDYSIIPDGMSDGRVPLESFEILCTQEDSTHDNSVDANESYDYEGDGIEVVPCTQAPGEEHYNESMDENEELVPATQPHHAVDGGESALDLSSVPCSQESVGLTSSGKEDLDDTLTLMTKLLELADEQEALEKAENKKECLIEQEDSHETSDKIKTPNTSATDINNVENKEVVEDEGKVAQVETQKEQEVLFKTPLRHIRVQNLKGKKLCTPSPPRTYVNSLLQKAAIRKTEVISKPVVLKSSNQKNSPKIPSAAARTPFTNITPAKNKNASSTPRKTPVAAKVDSGLRGRTPPFTVGLSPVANYIYSKPAPSTFSRVQGIPKTTTTTTTNISNNSSVSRTSSVSKIPSRVSQAQTISKTPNSATKEPRRHGPLRTSTFFDTSCTPPKIVSNEINEPKKRFQPLQYTGASKIKPVNTKVDSPQADYVAHRHTGLRDESGNASFIQNTFVQKKNIPQLRLVTPKRVTATTGMN